MDATALTISRQGPASAAIPTVIVFALQRASLAGLGGEDG